MQSYLKYAKCLSYMPDTTLTNQVLKTLNESHVCICTGSPGSGKTSLANELAHSLRDTLAVHWFDCNPLPKLTQSLQAFTNATTGSLIIFDDCQSIDHVSKFISHLPPSTFVLVTTSNEKLSDKIPCISIKSNYDLRLRYLIEKTKIRDKKIIEKLCEEFSSFASLKVCASYLSSLQDISENIRAKMSERVVFEALFSELKSNKTSVWQMLTHLAYLDGNFVSLRLISELNSEKNEKIDSILAHLKALNLVNEAQNDLQQPGVSINSVLQQKIREFSDGAFDFHTFLIIFADFIAQLNGQSEISLSLALEICFHSLMLLNQASLSDFSGFHELFAAFNSFQRRGNDSIELESALIELKKRVYGEKNDEMTLSYQKLADLQLRKRENLGDSLRNLQKSLDILLHLHGDDHISVANCVLKVAEWYFATNFFTEAIENYEKYLKLSHNSKILASIGDCYYEMGQFDKACECFKANLTETDEKILEKIANCYEMSENFGEAMRIYEKFNREYLLKNADRVSECFARANEPEKALEVLKKALEDSESRWMKASYCKKAAKCLQRLRRFDEALRYYDEYIGIERELEKESQCLFRHEKDFYELKALCLIEKGELPAASICFTQFIQKYDLSQRSIDELTPARVDFLLDNSRISESYVTLIKIASVFVDEVVISFYYDALAMFYEAAKDFEGALKSHQVSLEMKTRKLSEKMSESVVKVHEKVAQCLVKMNEYEKAIERYKICAESTHNGASLKRFLTLIASYYKQIGCFDIASEFYERYLKIDGLSPMELSDAYCHLAECYEAKEDFRAAIGFYVKASEVFETLYGDLFLGRVDFSERIGNCYEKVKKPAKAIRFYEKSLQMTVIKHGKGHELVRKCHQKLARCNETLGCFDKALEWLKKSDENGQIVEDFARIYEKLGEFKRAREFYERCLTVERTLFGEKSIPLAHTHVKIARCCEEMRDYGLAVEHWRANIEIKEANLGVKHHRELAEDCLRLAACLERMGDLQSSSVCYNKAHLMRGGENLADLNKE